jgi:hypothetical protein
MPKNISEFSDLMGHYTRTMAAPGKRSDHR